MSNSTPFLTDFSNTITFDEELVNFGPQLLDTDVTFLDADDNFDDGTLVMGGLLAEDILSVRDQGTGAGEIGFDGSLVTFEGITIGTVTGGSGGVDFSVVFNAAANSAAIEALIENLTYENLSDTPTAARTLTLGITNADGVFAIQPAEFNLVAGAADPFDGINDGNRIIPTFVDLDGDGDVDLIDGEFDGNLNYFENTGTSAAAIFTLRTGAADPFNGIDIGQFAAPDFVDIDDDGDKDLVIGESLGNLIYYENTGTNLAAVFALRTGAADPFDGIDIGARSVAEFVDIDNDGDDDLVIGEDDGILNYYENTGTTLAPVFTLRTGAASPFDGIDIGISSTPVFTDIDKDGDDDLVIGESTGTIKYFENTGNIFVAEFTQRTGTDNPFDGIDIGQFSTPSFTDIDIDGDDDLVIGGLDGPLNYYINTSRATSASFVSRSGAANPFDGIDIGIRINPSFIDLDGDGDQDLVIGEFDGNLNYYENTGTVLAPIYTVRTGAANPFDGINIGDFSTPSFTDLDGDGDGDQDLVIGEYDGNLNYYENTGTALAPSYIERTGAANPFDGIDVGLFSSPSYIDLDGDGDQDLVIGESSGNLNYYENTGTALVPIYTVSIGGANPFDGIDIGSFSTPSFIDLDSDGDQDLVIGEQNGNLNYYENTGTLLAPIYTVRIGGANPFDGIDIGDYSTPSFIDLDGDGDQDLVVGEGSGNLHYYENTTSSLIAKFTSRVGAANSFDGIDIGAHSTLSFVDIDNDGDQDMVIGESSGILNYYENTGTPLAPTYIERTGAANPFDGIYIGSSSTPSFIDLDNDGDQDLVIGESTGNLNYYENTGTALAPSYIERIGGANPFDGIDIGSSSTPSFIDLDGDGDQDLVIGGNNGNLYYYENTGTALAPTYIERTGAANPFDGIDIGSFSTPSFIDIDNDGDQDLVIGEFFGNLNYYENTGTALAPAYIERTGAANPFDGIDIGTDSTPSFIDLDGDGDQDLVIGETVGTLNYYENTGGGLQFVLNVTPHTDPSSSADVMNGMSGNDTIDGLGGDDTIRGHDGDDNLFGSDGDDMLDGGVDNDILIGNDGRDTLFGGAGDDDLFGNRGIDFLDPGSGQDDLDGGGDFDRVSYAGSSAGVTVNLDTGIGSGGDAAGDTFIRLERVTGSQFDDIITGNEFGNSLKGNDGADTIFGLSGRDVIEGRNGDDILHGGDKNDNILGGNDNDKLFGDEGFDKLFGELGDDELTGGADADYFIFNSSLGAFGGDVIFDFENGVDKLDVRDVFSIATPANTADTFSDFTVSVSGAFGVKIKFENGQVIYLDDAATGITVADIDASDFIFA